MPVASCAGFFADSCCCAGVVEGDVDGDLGEVNLPSPLKTWMPAPVAAVSDVDVSLGVGRDAVRSVELPGLVAWFTEGHEPFAILIDLGDARVDVAVADVRVAGRVLAYVTSVTWTELPADRGERRVRVFQRTRGFVGGLLLATEDHDDAAGGVELDDHVGALVGDPDVVVFVDADGVGVGPGIEIVADLAKVGAVGGKFEELGSGCSSRPARWRLPRVKTQGKDVSLGVDGDAGGGLAEVEIGGEA